MHEATARQPLALLHCDGHHLTLEEDSEAVIEAYLNQDIEAVAGEESAASDEMRFDGSARGCGDRCDLRPSGSWSFRIVNPVGNEVDRAPYLICPTRLI